MRKAIIFVVLVSLQGFLGSALAVEGAPVRLKNGSTESPAVADQIYHIFSAILAADRVTGEDLFHRSVNPHYKFHRPNALEKLTVLGLIGSDGTVPASVRNVVRSSIEQTPNGLLLTTPVGDPGAMYLVTVRAPLVYEKSEYRKQMEEENPAARAIMEKLWRLTKRFPNPVGIAEVVGIVDALDDMNMRGEQILLAYEYAGRRMEQFWNLVSRRDPDLVAFVNANAVLHRTEITEQAVTSGAKRMHRAGFWSSEVSAWKRGPITVELGDSAAFGLLKDVSTYRAARYGQVRSDAETRMPERGRSRLAEFVRRVRDAVTRPARK